MFQEFRPPASFFSAYLIVFGEYVVPGGDAPDVLEPALAAAHEDADADARHPHVFSVLVLGALEGPVLLVGGDGHSDGAENPLWHLMRRNEMQK